MVQDFSHQQYQSTNITQSLWSNKLIQRRPHAQHYYTENAHKAVNLSFCMLRPWRCIYWNLEFCSRSQNPGKGQGKQGWKHLQHTVLYFQLHCCSTTKCMLRTAKLLTEPFIVALRAFEVLWFPRVALPTSKITGISRIQRGVAGRDTRRS